ncbi:YheC/YheD family protein [Cohnella terricola]|uniref:YheC/YheD family protein n=1 Tax=Cohnella terricola TaxID=1289167 RepID=A0A559JBT7_9BACL|nr:YheC/YheD family protein [Cohnella terricola]TVX97317.1 YheC/YheD family protein [Cohnella terricola]
MPDTSPVSDINRVHTARSSFGILICEREGYPPFAESSYLKRLSLLGPALGLQTFAFDPLTWDQEDDSVKCWSWNSRMRKWEASRRKFPDIAYDRAWPETKEEKRRYRLAMGRIRAYRRFVLLSGNLPHKAKVYEMLARDREIAAIIPPTVRYRGPSSLASWLQKHRPGVFLKPIAGSQGKRVVAVVQAADGTVELTGRHGDNRPLFRSCASETEALNRLNKWIGGRTYIMQPLLNLRGNSGEAFDLRVLMQKDSNGRWSLTGAAARIGAPGSVTANLHGGGTATAAAETLVSLFGRPRGNELIQEIDKFSYLIAVRLEQSFGRFAEIGLDYGIERNGKLWFLEANSKPGRAAMIPVGRDAAIAAAAQPLSYAKFILLRLATTDARRLPRESAALHLGG